MRRALCVCARVYLRPAFARSLACSHARTPKALKLKTSGCSTQKFPPRAYRKPKWKLPVYYGTTCTCCTHVCYASSTPRLRTRCQRPRRRRMWAGLVGKTNRRGRLAGNLWLG
ncbi:hypothetical protein B0H63DRAFT_280908 [Podospora didyma]|uniref:Uncharacterized protein n=1 Tax=Podospora didyma TaxID=330526 RepID=A0AAE0KF24_9PEZI|nr:hypothetical protein B0H63DRAFT_280908 [Podospora didyma]